MVDQSPGEKKTSKCSLIHPGEKTLQKRIDKATTFKKQLPFHNWNQVAGTPLENKEMEVKFTCVFVDHWVHIINIILRLLVIDVTIHVYK